MLTSEQRKIIETAINAVGWEPTTKEGMRHVRLLRDSLRELLAASAAPAEGREPTGDELRKLTREIRDASGGPSDAPQPADYVLGGWRAALATAPTMSEAAKWDAARYRFLRKTAMRVQAKTNSHPHWLFGGFEMCGATFDDAIDAAIDRAAAKGESDERI
jgi:hypothetical protein